MAKSWENLASLSKTAVKNFLFTRILFVYSILIVFFLSTSIIVYSYKTYNTKSTNKVTNIVPSDSKANKERSPGFFNVQSKLEEVKKTVAEKVESVKKDSTEEQKRDPTRSPTSAQSSGSNSTDSQSSGEASPTATKIPTPTVSLSPTEKISTPTPTPTSSNKSTTPTAVPTSTPVVPTATFTPAPTSTPVQNETQEFSYTLYPYSNFTTQASGGGSGKVVKNTNGYYDFTISGNFGGLMPNREYQLWLCGKNCSSSDGAKFKTDGSGNGGFSSAKINHPQWNDSISKIGVWENPPTGELPNDSTACFFNTKSPCLSKDTFF